MQTNYIYNEFHSKLIAVIDENAPYKSLYKQKSKIKQKLRITKSVCQNKKQKKQNIHQNKKDLL